MSLMYSSKYELKKKNLLLNCPENLCGPAKTKLSWVTVHPGRNNESCRWRKTTSENKKLVTCNRAVLTNLSLLSNIMQVEYIIDLDDDPWVSLACLSFSPQKYDFYYYLLYEFP